MGGKGGGSMMGSGPGVMGRPIAGPPMIGPGVGQMPFNAPPVYGVMGPPPPYPPTGMPGGYPPQMPPVGPYAGGIPGGGGDFPVVQHTSYKEWKNDLRNRALIKSLQQEVKQQALARGDHVPKPDEV